MSSKPDLRADMLRSSMLSLALALGMIAIPAMAVAQTSAPASPAIHQMTDLKIAATIPIGKRADWVAIAPKTLWIGSKDPNAVSEVDPATNTVSAVVTLPGVPCAGLALDANSLWVPLCGPVPQLAQIDLKTRTLKRVLKVGPPAGEGGIASGAGSIWLITDKVGTLSRIDPESGEVIKAIALPAGSFNPVFSGGRIWITRFGGAEVTIVDPATSAVVGTVPVGAKPRFVTTGAGAVWTLNQQDGTLNRIDVTGRQPVQTIALNIPGAGGDITYGDGRIWTTLMKTPLTAVDATNSKVLCQWQGEGGDSLGVGHGAIWLTNLVAGTMSRINLADLPADCSVPPK